MNGNPISHDWKTAYQRREFNIYETLIKICLLYGAVTAHNWIYTYIIKWMPLEERTKNVVRNGTSKQQMGIQDKIIEDMKGYS